MSTPSRAFFPGDLNLIADKMLDNFTRYRRSDEEGYLENARRYAAILKLDGGGSLRCSAALARIPTRTRRS